MRYRGTILFKGESARDDRVEVQELLVLPDAARIRLVLYFGGYGYKTDTPMRKVAADTYRTDPVHLIDAAGSMYPEASVMTVSIVRRLSRSIEVTGLWEEGGHQFDFDEANLLKAV